MNATLQLKGTFEQRKNSSTFSSPNLPSGESIDANKLSKLLSDLERLLEYWQQDNTLSGALISVYYNKIAAKSNSSSLQRILASIPCIIGSSKTGLFSSSASDISS